MGTESSETYHIISNRQRLSPLKRGAVFCYDLSPK
jgi:hypothetical protein